MEAILIPLAAMLIPIVIVPTILGIKHARFLREVEHKERMRAMELGRPMPEDEALTPAGMAASIGLGVPLGSLGLAWLAGVSMHNQAEPFAVAAGVIGVCGVLCGTFLAARQSSARNQQALMSQDAAKVEYDPDAYDVVGRRG